MKTPPKIEDKTVIWINNGKKFNFRRIKKRKIGLNRKSRNQRSERERDFGERKGKRGRLEALIRVFDLLLWRERESRKERDREGC